MAILNWTDAKNPMNPVLQWFKGLDLDQMKLVFGGDGGSRTRFNIIH